MRKIITSLALVGLMAAPFSASAVYTTPSEGTINMEANPGGIAGFDIGFGEMARINRDAMGFITLTRDGEVVKQLAASNAFNLQMIEGFTIVEVSSTANVSFFPSILAAGPAMMVGNYTVTIPGGFYLLGDDPDNLVPSEPMTFNWNIKAAAESDVVITPEVKVYSPISVPSLDKFTLTFPVGAVVTSVNSNPTQREVEETDDDGNPTGEITVVTDYPISLTGNGKIFVPYVEFDGNVVTLDFANGYDGNMQGAAPTEGGEYVLDIEGGAVTYTLNGSPASSKEVSGKIILQGDSWYTVKYPASTTVSMFEATEVDAAVQGGLLSKATIILELPEVAADEKTIYNKSMGSVYLTPVNADGTYSTSDARAIRLYPYAIGGKYEGKKPLYLCAQSKNGLANDTYSLALSKGRYALVLGKNLITRMNPTAMSPETTLFFDVTADNLGNIKFDPAPGSKMSSVYDVTVTFPEGETAVYENNFYQNSAKFYSSMNNGIDFYMETVIDEETPNVVTFTTPHHINVPGNWSFQLPSSGFRVGNTIYSIGCDYTVEKAGDLKWEVTPADKAKVNKLEEIEIKFNDAAVINTVFYTGILTGNNEALGSQVTVDEGVATIKLADVVETSGEYTLEIPAGSFVRGYLGDVPAINLTYTVDAAAEPETPEQNPEIVGAAGEVTSLEEVTISWADFASVAIAEAFDAQLVPATRAEAIALTGKVVEGAEVPTVSLTPASEVGEGSYTLTIAAGSFTLTTKDGVEVASEEIKSDVTVATSVASLLGEEGVADIYGLNGVCVMRNANASSVNALPEGIYVVNGKKVIVRK